MIIADGRTVAKPRIITDYVFLSPLLFIVTPTIPQSVQGAESANNMKLLLTTISVDTMMMYPMYK